MIALLAGGTGGAKLARGLLDALPPNELTVIANTADDLEVYGVHVSPDPDLVTYRLADVIDEERGYGIRGDTWRVMEALEAAGIDAWFRLGDRDLATCLARTALLRAGGRLTTAAERLARSLDVGARVIPMSDDPVRTHVRADGRWRSLQEFLISDGAALPIEAVEVRGADDARPAPEALAALAEAEAILIGPSNPVISIGPILALPGMREAIAGAEAPVVAVSPFLRGRAVKGPTEAFCAQAGIAIGAHGIARAYGDLIDGVVADEPLVAPPDVPLVAPPDQAVGAPAVASLAVDTLMDTPERRRRVAAATVQFAASLRA